MKCLFLLSGKNKKIISKCHLLKFLPSMLRIKYLCIKGLVQFRCTVYDNDVKYKFSSSKELLEE